jgi:hypothetical protein
METIFPNEAERKWRLPESFRRDSYGDSSLDSGGLDRKVCKRGHVNKGAVYEWLKYETFCQELKKK